MDCLPHLLCLSTPLSVLGLAGLKYVLFPPSGLYPKTDEAA